MTNETHWFDIAKKLYDQKIAEPILWIGDDVHYEKASEIFGKNVVKSQNFVHRPYEFTKVDYNGEYQDFFHSDNYIRAKDRCLKMLDRLDLYGLFNRLDREVYFHNLVIWTLKKFHKLKIDALISAEAPHDHAKYVIYEICRYLKIPTYKFQNWMPVPVLYLQNIETEEIISVKKSHYTEIYNRVERDLINYVDELKNRSEDYEIPFMKRLRENDEFFNRIINFFKYGIYKSFLDIRHNTGRLIKRKYNPINPFRFNFISRSFNKITRTKNLYKAATSSSIDINLNDKYVYFPLHFEPERTTNPDGKEFHDQFIAITKLREIIPESFKIIIKEHPTQLNKHLSRGVWGRSPLFYDLVKNINGVEIADVWLNSADLIKNSEFVSCITGTVAIEAAIMGKKALTFGSTYFDGCPNILKWKKGMVLEKLMNLKLQPPKAIEDFLLLKLRKYGVVGFQNGGQRGNYKKYHSKEFEDCLRDDIYQLLKEFFKMKDHTSSNQIRLNQSPWSKLDRPFLIAEIGGNHEGKFEKAKEMLNLAIDSGADCIKFQIYSADSIVSKVESPDRHKHFKKFELSKEQHIELAKICKSKGVYYTSSIWSDDYLDWIDPYLDFYKIGSGDMTAFPLIKAIVKKEKPIILSTGLSSIDEVLDSVAFIQNCNSKYKDPSMLCLLQCTAMYPIKKRDVNLNVMLKYKELTGLASGYSDHTEGIEALKIASNMGADVLEFHFTDSREDKVFRDHKVSLIKNEVIELKKYIKDSKEIKGDPEKKLQMIELENNHNISFRRGVYLNKSVKKGEIIKLSDLIFLRPAKGTDARMYDEVIGSTVLKDINPLKAIEKNIDYEKK